MERYMALETMYTRQCKWQIRLGEPEVVCGDICTCLCGGCIRVISPECRPSCWHSHTLAVLPAPFFPPTPLPSESPSSPFSLLPSSLLYIYLNNGRQGVWESSATGATRLTPCSPFTGSILEGVQVGCGRWRRCVKYPIKSTKPNLMRLHRCRKVRADYPIHPIPLRGRV